MFLHPWAMLVGVLAAGLPVLIHFLTRPRPVPVQLSTWRFLREVVQQRRARHRLRDAIVLALRTAAVLLLGALIARPLLGRMESPQTEHADTIRIVILDASQSMGAVVRGIQVFERARPLAAKRLDYRPGMRANLILAGARPAAVFEQPSTNYSALRDELDRAAPFHQQLNVALAINLAAQMLGSSGDQSVRRELVIISDFQRSNWANADFSALPNNTVIELESVAPAETAPNLGVLRVASQGRPEVGREMRLEVDVGNYSSTPQNVRIDVTLGTNVYQIIGVCAPQSKTSLTGDVVPRTIGWLVGEARLVDVTDSLAEDNVRPFVLEVRPQPKIVLVSRQSPEERPSSSYFLECALTPARRSTPSAGASATGTETAAAVMSRLDPTRLDQDLLARAEFIVLDHPGRLSPELTNQLAGLLRRGRGLLYVAAESGDAANLRQLAEGAGILLPVDFVPPAAGQIRRNLVLQEIRRDQAPFQVFGDELTTLVKPLRFSGGLETRQRDGSLAEDILAQLSDRSAFLVAAGGEGGGLMVLNADLGASNLPGSPLFVPLLGELTLRLLGRGQAAREIASGEMFAVALPAEIEGIHDLRIAGPASTVDAGGELLRESHGVLWKSEAAGPPGAYRIQRREETLFALATAVPAAESDLRTLAAEVFQERLAGGRKVQFHSASAGDGDERDRLWTWLAVACVVSLIVELGALKWFKT